MAIPTMLGLPPLARGQENVPDQIYLRKIVDVV